MHKTSVIVLAAIIGVIALNVGPQRANSRLAGELSALGPGERELANLRAENQRLNAELAKRTDTSEFAAELAALQQQAKSLRPPAGTAGNLKVGNRSLFFTPWTPRKDIIEFLQPGGLSSPMRAWFTLSNAGHGEGRSYELLEATFCFDERGQAKLDAFLAALPESAREKFRCREGLVAPVFDVDRWLWKGNHPTSFSPLRDVPMPGDPGRAESCFRVTYASGEKREERFPFKRFDDGWRYGPLTESDADQLLAMLDPNTGLPKPPQP